MEFEKLLGQLYTNDGEKKTASAMAPFTGEIDVEMLDYPYIGKCNDPAELEAILELLKSGKEGYYPHLEEFAFDRLRTIAPERIVPRNEPASWSDLETVRNELKEWSHNISPHHSPSPMHSNDQLYCKVDNKNCDDVDETTIFNSPLAKLPDSVCRSIRSMRSKLPSTDLQVLSEEEKQKGNESLRAGDLKDAIRSYTKSLLLHPQAHLFSNRSLAYLKLKHYGHVIQDASSALRLNCDQPKAYYRRALAHRSLKQYDQAVEDLQCVLELDSGHDEATKLLNELESLMADSVTTDASNGGSKPIPIIETTDSDSDGEEGVDNDNADEDESISSDEDDEDADLHNKIVELK